MHNMFGKDIVCVVFLLSFLPSTNNKFICTSAMLLNLCLIFYFLL